MSKHRNPIINALKLSLAEAIVAYASKHNCNVDRMAHICVGSGSSMRKIMMLNIDEVSLELLLLVSQKLGAELHHEQCQGKAGIHVKYGRGFPVGANQ